MNKPHNVKEVFKVNNPVFDYDADKLFAAFTSIYDFEDWGKDKAIDVSNLSLRIRDLRDASYWHSSDPGSMEMAKSKMDGLNNEFLNHKKAAIEAVQEVIECFDGILSRITKGREEALNVLTKFENCESNVVTEVHEFPEVG